MGFLSGEKETLMTKTDTFAIEEKTSRQGNSKTQQNMTISRHVWKKWNTWISMALKFCIRNLSFFQIRNTDYMKNLNTLLTRLLKKYITFFQVVFFSDNSKIFSRSENNFILLFWPYSIYQHCICSYNSDFKIDSVTSLMKLANSRSCGIHLVVTKEKTSVEYSDCGNKNLYFNFIIVCYNESSIFMLRNQLYALPLRSKRHLFLSICRLNEQVAHF